MDELAAFMGAGGVLVIGIFLLVVVILWFLLPFSVFGIKPKLDEIIELQEAMLREMREASGKEILTLSGNQVIEDNDLPTDQ
jgi:hypothetical protein